MPWLKVWAEDLRDLFKVQAAIVIRICVLKECSGRHLWIHLQANALHEFHQLIPRNLVAMIFVHKLEGRSEVPEATCSSLSHKIKISTMGVVGIPQAPPRDSLGTHWGFPWLLTIDSLGMSKESLGIEYRLGRASTR